MTTTAGATATLIKDINTLDTQPSDVIDVGGTAFYTVTNASGGTDLYKSDGSVGGTSLLKSFGLTHDIQLTAVGSTLYFRTSDLNSSGHLWKSDGTAAGTVALGNVTTYPSNLTAVGSELFYTTYDGNNGTELWKTDGTPGGTVDIKDVTDADGGSLLSNFTAVGSTLYFTAGSNGALWKSDGTTGGTAAIQAAGLSGPFNGLTPVGSTLYFLQGYSFSGSQNLWKSDGTDVGTTEVKAFQGSNYLSSGVANLTAAGSTLYFTVGDVTHGNELWASDGTAGGTALVKDVVPGSGSSYPSNLTAVGPTLYFSADGGPTGRELFKTDGTDAGTAVVRDLHPIGGGYSYNTYSNNPGAFATLGGSLYFADNDPTSGPELFKTDGSTTTLVKDLIPGPDGSEPQFLKTVGGLVYFSGHTVPGTNQLLRTDGTSAGTFALQSFDPSRTQGSIRSYEGFLGHDDRPLQVGGSTLFLADDGLHGTELWKTDGTAAGTVLVKDINPNGDLHAYAPVLFNGAVYFGVLDPTGGGISGLWRTDGTAAGTSLVKGFSTAGSSGQYAFPGASNLTVAGGALYFTTYDGVHGFEVWKTTGTADSTVMLKDVNPSTAAYGLYGSLDSPTGLTAVGATLFFAEDDGVHGKELWKTDGTADGTVLVKDVNSTGNAGLNNSSNPGDLTAVGSTLFFVADDGIHGSELWKSDGTAGGTVLVKDVNPTDTTVGYSYVSPKQLTAVGSTLFFSADDGIHGREIWKSDGTAGGTVLVKDINPNGTDGSSPNDLIAENSKLLFTASDGANGKQVWSSDGTAGGTVMLTDINPGSDLADGIQGYGYPFFHSVGGLLYFIDTGASSETLYRTDGTVGGTAQIPLDPNLGATGGPGPQLSILGASPGGLIVGVDDGVHGAEPYLVPGGIVNRTPTVNPVANLAAGVNRTLTIPVTASDPDVGQGLTYSLDNAPAYASIVAGTGVVTFKARLAGTYRLTVRATDSGTPALSATTTLTVVVSGSVPSDYDGDGKSDLAVYRPSQAMWIVRNSSGGTLVTKMGDASAGDLAAPGDYDGDGKTDLAVYRPSQGVWIIRNSSGGTLVTNMGDPSAGDVAAPGDYDGDGKTDLAVYRPSQALWIIRFSSGGSLVTKMGDPAAGDISAPGDYDGDGKADLAVYRPSQGVWIIRNSSGGTLVTNMGDAGAGDIPAPGDYDGDGKTDLAVYRPSQALWIIRYSSGGSLATKMGDPSAGDVAAQTSPYFQKKSRLVVPAVFTGQSAPSANFDRSASASSPAVAVVTTPAGLVPQPSRVATVASYRPPSSSIAINGTTT